jgi:hypothetical protein
LPNCGKNPPEASPSHRIAHVTHPIYHCRAMTLLQKKKEFKKKFAPAYAACAASAVNTGRC